ncbi:MULTISPECIES: hypothetical protein [unclassified Kitasatospora]|uniref:hypothetical protein n=1 Tax=unclassified Kitasatospora TaxID=2633591 RepID=UPI0033F716BE
MVTGGTEARTTPTAKPTAPGAALLARAGSTEPAAEARRLICWCDGGLFNSTAGSGHGYEPTLEELRDEVADYVAALLDRPGR